MTTENTYPRIIAGTMTWGSWGKKFGTAEMVSMMHACLELGLTAFDHADIYGGYTNEADFGRAFAESGLGREQLQLISKCGIRYVCEARDYTIKHYNYDTDYIIWSCEESLKNLRTEYLDLFLLHRPSPLMHPDTIAEAARKLLKSGKIRAFGISNFTPSQIVMLETEIALSAHQLEFSLSTHSAMYDGSLDDCIAHKRMAMAWSPLGSFYSGTGEQEARIRELFPGLQDKYNASSSQLLLAWILKHPAGVHPVIGTTGIERLAEAVRAMEIELSLEDWFAMLAASQGHKVP